MIHVRISEGIRAARAEAASICLAYALDFDSNLVTRASREEDIMAKLGEKVWADTGDGPRIGFIIGEAGDKDKVQVGDAVYQMAHREPEDRDEHGSGLTWWTL